MGYAARKQKFSLDKQKMSEEVEQHILKRFELVKKVGSGAYGHVWKAIDKKSKATVGLKKIFDAFQHSTDAQRTFREITLLHELNHPNIIKLLNVFRAQNDKDIYLVFEYMEADLHNVISERILQDIHNRFILYQILKAIKYLHSAELIHRDLKPSNVLINSDCQLKVCDFGLVRCLAADKEGDNIVLTEEVATRWYRAPEVLLGSKTYDKPADIWSVGCILAEMLLFKPIFPGNSTLNQLQRILTLSGKPSKEDISSLESELAVTMIDSIKQMKCKPIREWFNNTIPDEAVDLVSRLLEFNPNKRLTAEQALRHPYLAQFHNKKEEINSPNVIRPPISDNKKLTLKEYRNILYDQIKKLYKDETSSAAKGIELTTPKRKSESKEKDKRSQHSSTENHNVSSSSKSRKEGKFSCSNLAKGTLKDKENQIRNILLEEKQKLEKRATGYLVKRKEPEYPKQGQTLYQGTQKPTYTFKQEKERKY